MHIINKPKKMLKKKRKNSQRTKKISSFLFKLYEILKDNSYLDIIFWKDNNSILIKDQHELTETVLPKFFKHNNYSSFVRQLNLYGFYKSKGLIKEGELFQHAKLTKNSTKEQIEQIISQNKMDKINSKNISNDNEIEKKDNPQNIITNNIPNGGYNFNYYSCNDNYILKYFLEKNEEHRNDIFELKNEIIDLKAQNKVLIETINRVNSKILGQNIIFEKILLKINNANKEINKINPKSESIYELFKKYLYHLKIYSPYLGIKKENNIVNKVKKNDSFKIKKIDDSINRNFFNYKINNIYDIYNNSNIIMNGYSVINQRPNTQNLIFNLLNNNNSNSFLYGRNKIFENKFYN